MVAGQRAEEVHRALQYRCKLFYTQSSSLAVRRCYDKDWKTKTLSSAITFPRNGSQVIDRDASELQVIL